ncbi:hypothetical protein [Acinetobacter baumannii]|uniref:hypothetical protein n=1 Tax=Acinetobacter baumannii TaxID=470 RepID=UPI002449830F|nr:hypothetical protein [Acinetobacter baumannii]MDH2523301.1 hypothetical protein [Acinetobacter baumannii]
MAIDASIPLQAQGINVAKMIDDGSQIGQIWQQQRLNKELDRIYNESQGNVDKMLQLGQQSQMARYIVPQLQAQQAASQKNLLDQQKTLAEVGKINAETGKIGSETGITLQNNAGSVWGAFLNGGAGAAKAQLENLKNRGLIDPISYQSEADALANLPLGAKEQLDYARGRFAGLQDPKFTLQSKDNEANNQTQTAIADANRKFDYDKLESDEQYRRDALGQDDAQFWAEYGQRDAQFSTSQDTERLKIAIQKQVTAEKPEQKMDRINNAIASADATAQAARAAKDAAELINHPGLNMGTGLTSAFGMIPSTEAKDFQARLENLKSQVFLPTVKAMQGMGALSNAEGEKIAAAVANLDPRIGPEAMKQQLSIIAKQMANAAQKSKQQTLNYASRGGTIPLNKPQPQQQAGSGKVFTRAMVQEYSQQTGVPVKEIIAQIQQSGGSVL